MSEDEMKCPKCGGPVAIRKISLNKVQISCERCGHTWVE